MGYLAHQTWWQQELFELSEIQKTLFSALSVCLTYFKAIRCFAYLYCNIHFFPTLSFFVFLSRCGWTQVPRYFSHMESVWGVSRPSAVITNTTIIAISETLCQTHQTHTMRHSSPPLPHTKTLFRYKVLTENCEPSIVSWISGRMVGMDKENTLI